MPAQSVSSDNPYSLLLTWHLMLSKHKSPKVCNHALLLSEGRWNRDTMFHDYYVPTVEVFLDFDGSHGDIYILSGQQANHLMSVQSGFHPFTMGMAALIRNCTHNGGSKVVGL